MSNSIVSFKKKLGFASLLVLASFALSQQGFAMDVDGGEAPPIEEDQNNNPPADQTDKKSEKNKKRMAGNTDKQKNKKRKAGNTDKPNNKKQKLNTTNNGSTTGETPSPVPTSLSSDPFPTDYTSMDTPAAAELFLNMMGDLSDSDYFSASSASSSATEGLENPMPTTTAAASSSTTTTTSTPPLADSSVAPAVPYSLPPLSLEKINDLIAQAKQNDPVAQNKLMQYVYHGLYRVYLPPQEIDFLNWKSPRPGQTLQAYCAENDFYALYVLAYYNKIGSKFPGLLEAVKSRADQGHAPAQFILGEAYWTGKGVEKQDFIQAVKYWKLAADQGEAAAQYALGEAYWSGKGVEKKDFKEAVKYWKLAADQGLAIAQFNLGNAYGNGNGVEKQDFKEAVKYWKLAADQGLAIAQTALGHAYWNGNGVEKQDFKEAVKYWKLAADQGLAIAQTALGHAYWNGNGVEKQDFKEAVKYWKLAADQGNANALFNLGNAYGQGNGVKKNIATALRYKLASKNADHNPFVSTHLSYLPFVAWKNEIYVDKLKKIIDTEKRATPQGGLAFLLNRHQTRKAEEEKYLPLPEICKLYKDVIQIEEEAIDLFAQLPQAIKKGFMVPHLFPGSPEVAKDYEEQSLPRQLGSYVIDNVQYLTFGEKGLKLQDLLLGIDEKFKVVDQALETLSFKYKKTEFDGIQQELFSKKSDPQPAVQEECKKLYARMQSLSKPLMEIQEERDVLTKIREEVRTFIPYTARNRQEIFLSEYPAIPRKQ